MKTETQTPYRIVSVQIVDTDGQPHYNSAWNGHVIRVPNSLDLPARIADEIVLTYHDSSVMASGDVRVVMLRNAAGTVAVVTLIK